MIDVLDTQGEKTGQILELKEVHRQGLWHRTAHIWVVTSKGNILFQQRSPILDVYPNCWDISASGHIRTGQTSLEGAIAETQEEIGLSLKPNSLEFLTTLQHESEHNQGTNINREFQDVYLVTQDVSLNELTILNTEVSNLQFIHWSKLRRLVDNHDQGFAPRGQEYQLLFSILQQRYP